MRADVVQYVRKCQRCQEHARVQQISATELWKPNHLRRSQQLNAGSLYGTTSLLDSECQESSLLITAPNSPTRNSKNFYKASTSISNSPRLSTPKPTDKSKP
ncbi:hypothetical protein PIB30_017528 [Stylosanthes scabra]|uniref:Integrase zinc-binding domain-containing protein n=1 Tax=Stylosanthes scabra TaxID=79078 RepID=A0ABU6S731_9FABA|nr:hypothetical protein [Stylosanthes scabra]